MPPRISPLRVSTPRTCQCFRTRPQTLSEPVSRSSTRKFHVSPQHQKRNATALRRDMWAWLQGAGKAFRDPLPGSTNYMSAYDNSGKLRRTLPNRTERDGNNDVETDMISTKEEEAIQMQEIEDGLGEKERKSRFQQRQAARKAEAEAQGGTPKERASDMRPYPLNQHFRSQSVLSENLREEVYQQVVTQGIDISTVSASFAIDTRRVAAVVRLKTIEKQWIKEGQQLAKPYNDAVMSMLPQTPFDSNNPRQHEPINDLPVHPRTRQQIFYPVSESRHFTREDAARVFDDTLLTADERVPHPELIAIEKDNLQGLTREERWERQAERDEINRKVELERDEARRSLIQRTQKTFSGRRWDFKFQDISAEKTGKDGRARDAVGARYGMPHEDRKRGMVKIPTSVE